MKYVQTRLFSRPRNAVTIEMPCDRLPSEIYYNELINAGAQTIKVKTCTNITKFISAECVIPDNDVPHFENLHTIIAVASHGSPVVYTMTEKGIFQHMIYAAAVLDDNDQVLGVLIGVDYIQTPDDAYEVQQVDEAYHQAVVDEVNSRSSANESLQSFEFSIPPSSGSPPVCS